MYQSPSITVEATSGVMSSPIFPVCLVHGLSSCLDRVTGAWKQPWFIEVSSQGIRTALPQPLLQLLLAFGEKGATNTREPSPLCAACSPPRLTSRGHPGRKLCPLTSAQVMPAQKPSMTPACNLLFFNKFVEYTVYPCRSIF